MLFVTILVIIISLSAVVYAAALTNPGHGVEEIGSGSSPYAPFRDWNVLEAGYEDQYSGPLALKANVFWLATTNAETIAAQNSSADWCAIQVHPSGIYMNCFNNASNMTLFQGYYWNGTNFTKNDTIKNGTAWIEKDIIQAGANGGQKIMGFRNPAGDTFSITSGSTTGSGASSTTTATNAAGATSETTLIPTSETTESTDAAGNKATGTIAGGAGITFGNKDGGGTDIGGGLTATPTAGTDLFNYATGGGGTILSQFTLFEDANGGTLAWDLTNAGLGVITMEQTADHSGTGNNPSIVKKIKDGATTNTMADVVIKQDTTLIKGWISTYDPVASTEQSAVYVDYDTGTTKSSAKLYGDSATVTGLATVDITAGTGTTNITMNSTEIRFWTNHSTRMYIGENGKTGVGLINPQTMLDIINATRIVPQSSPPYVCAVALEGAIYYDSDVHRLCFCNSTTWLQVDDSNTTCN